MSSVRFAADLVDQLGEVLVRRLPDLWVRVGEVGWQRHTHLRRVSLHGLVNATLVVVTTTASFSTSGSTVSRPLSINPLIIICV